MAELIPLPAFLPAEDGREEPDPGVEVLLPPVAQAGHGETGVLEGSEEAGTLVAPLGHQVRVQREHPLHVGHEVGGGDVVLDLEHLGEELPEDAVAHRGPRGLVHSHEMGRPLVDGDDE